MCRNQKFNPKKGSIGITIVMLVFCLLMSVSMSYHKTIQTETMIQNNSNYTDRAIDAAFSGVNYAMAVIQSNKKVFANENSEKVLFTKDGGGTDTNNIKSQWINLASTASFNSYLDDDRGTAHKQLPPYRFKIACTEKSYIDATTILIKSYGEYIKYDENNNILSSYSAQLMAECFIETNTKTIRLNRYRKMLLQNPEPGDESNPSFFSFESKKFDSDT